MALQYRVHRGVQPDMRSLLLLCPVLLTLSAAPARAQDDATGPASEAATARLPVLSTDERRLLAPYLARGPIGFVEFAPTTELPAILLAVKVGAPPATVAAVLSNPRGYPRFMPALDRVEVESHNGPLTAYRWRWTTAVFTLEGRNVMTVYPPPPPESLDRGYRIAVRATGGDMGTGRMLWRVYPDGPGSLLVFSSRIDMRDANYIARQMSSGGGSINRTINMSLAYVMMLSARHEAERQAHFRPPPPGPLPPLTRPTVDIEALKFMLIRGDLVFLDMHGDDVAQVVVVSRTGKNVPPVRAVMTDPTEFGQSLVSGSTARVVGPDGRGQVFEWAIPLPLVGSSGRMRIEEIGSVITVDGVSGALHSGQWRFDTLTYPWGEAVVLGWARFDPAESSWLIERLVDGVPYFREGLMAAGQLMIARSVRTRALQRHQ